MKSKHNKIDELTEKLNYYAKQYYENDISEINDYEYDMLLRELRELEEENPELMHANSPTHRVGGAPLPQFSQVEHTYPMESLQDVFSIEETEDFVNGILSKKPDTLFSCEVKIDGLSVCLSYENGKLIMGVTRGDGKKGEDVTKNIMTIKDIPLNIDDKEPLIVRGEVYMSTAVFTRLNAEREEANEPLLANPRNAAAGALRQLDPKICAKRKLSFFAFNIQNANERGFTSHAKTLDWLKKQKMPTVKHIVSNDMAQLEAFIDDTQATRGNLGYGMDGIVIKVDGLALREQMGSTSKNPRWAVAYKYPPEEKQTILRDIVIKVGRTGVLTPNAEFDTVVLAGTKVSRATLHNESFIKEKDIRVGDTIIVRKAGEIIPEVVGVVAEKREKNSTPFEMPRLCPVCGAKVLFDPEQAAAKCTGAECPAQISRKIAHFASKNAMDIDGLGSAVVEILYRENLIKTPADLYTLSADEIENLPKMGKTSAKKLVESIAKSKDAGMARLLFGLGIDLIGVRAAKLIAEHINSIEELAKTPEGKLTAIPEIGEKMAHSIVEWLNSEQGEHLVSRLVKEGIDTNSHETKVNGALLGKTFVITGTLENYTRTELQELIESVGGKVSTSVSKKTSYLVLGEDGGSKHQKAIQLGIEIIDENAVEKMLKEAYGGNDE